MVFFAYNFLIVGPLTMKLGMYTDIMRVHLNNNSLMELSAVFPITWLCWVLEQWNFVYFSGEIAEDNESEVINTLLFLYGDYAQMHVHAIKKGKLTSKKSSN